MRAVARRRVAGSGVHGSGDPLDRYRAGWIAGFAHYDATGGVPFKNHRFSSVVTFDAEWRRTGGWPIALEAEGQAFSWAQDGSRTVFTVDRRKGLVRVIELPSVHPADPVVSLRFR